MAVQKGACKNHPQLQSSRRCFYCKQYVCSECQQKHEHHIFCSWSCFVKWKLKPLAKKIWLRRNYIFLILMILLSDLVLYLILKPDPERTQPLPAQSNKTPADSVWIKSDTSLVASRFAIDIMVEVKGSQQPLLLWKNGQFIGSQPARNGLADFGRHYFSKGRNSYSLWTVDKNGLSRRIDSFSVFFSSARLDYLEKQLSRISTSQKVLALTFDGGSSNKTTAQILDTLRSRNVTCTMFLTGSFMHHFPDLVRRIAAEGHEIGNHSFSHPHLTRLEIDGSSVNREYVDRPFVQSQLEKVDSLFRILTGKHLSPLWRAPFGEVNPEILRWAAEAGYKHVNWSMKGDSWDWVADSSSGLYRTAEQIYSHYTHLEQQEGLNGRILLMHLGSERTHDFPFKTLGRLIDTLHARGYQFKKISEIQRVKMP